MSWIAIWLVLVGLTPADEDKHETLEERAHRVRPVAMAIYGVTADLDTQAAMLATAEAESNVSSLVMSGGCRKGGCDGGRAKGIFQLHPWCEASFDPADLDGQALCARRALLGPKARCGSWEKAFGGYMAGSGCRPHPWRERLRLRMKKRLAAAEWRLKQAEVDLAADMSVEEVLRHATSQ